MHVVVCVKQIPDPAEPGKLEADNTLDRSGKLILDESDSYGVEMALQLVDKAGGGEVTLVSVTAGVVEPRYPSFKGIMAAKSKPVEELDLAGLGIDASSVGTAGAGQE